MRAFAVATVTLLLTSGSLAGQSGRTGADDLLRETERLIEQHDYEAARETIERFWSSPGPALHGERRARALMLRAILSNSWADAELDLLTISVEHAQSADADDALLRLAQAKYAAGDADAARVYLERLVRDHPTSPHRSSARELLGVSEPLPSVRSPTPEPRSTLGARPPPPEGVELTVELGRFSEVAAAEALRDAVRQSGFSAFLARVGREGSTVVRVGSFHDRTAADETVRRLRQAGFAADVAAVSQP